MPNISYNERDRDSLPVDHVLIKKKLLELRKAGTSADALAGKCGVSPSLISGMKNDIGRHFDRALVIMPY